MDVEAAGVDILKPQDERRKPSVWDNIGDGDHMILYFPGSPKGDEFIIVPVETCDFDEKLEDGALLRLKEEGNNKTLCHLVRVFESYQEAQECFKASTDEFLRILDNAIKLEESRSRILAKRKASHERKRVAKDENNTGASAATDDDSKTEAENFVVRRTSRQILLLNRLIRDNCRAKRKGRLSKRETHRKHRVKKPLLGEEPDENIVEINGMVGFGSGPTMMPKKVYSKIPWGSIKYTLALRKVLRAVFSNQVLATHSLSGKPSPAFIGRQKEIKPQLDPVKVNDIIGLVQRKYSHVPVLASQIRLAITTALGDAKKTLKEFKEKNMKVKKEAEEETDEESEWESE